VREAVVSVLAQSYRDFELIVVDDGSRDGSAAALRREFGEQLVLIETPNRGVSAARNTGAAAARGELLAFLDSDDVWRPRKLRAQVDYFESHPRMSICHTEEIWIRRGVRVNPCRHHAKPEGDVFLPSLERCLVSPSAVMLRRDLFARAGGFDERMPACEDYDLWLRLAREARVGLVREPLVIKRGGHADQLSRRFWGLDRFRVAALRKLLDEPLTAAQRRATVEVLGRKCAILAAGAERRGRASEAAQYRAMAERDA
jgi:glycosyltransferase involved in cell wall biosynthesis